MKTAFPPVISDRSRVLILGSMPGEISLTQQQYYAHPRNAFWWIMQHLFAIDCTWPYAQRLQALDRHGIAVWDVLHRCQREGSLDSAIQHDTAQANDFAHLLKSYPTLCAIGFNGKSVASLFQRHVVKAQGFLAPIPTLTLPSTSPANARLRPQQKLTQWQQILAYLAPPSAT